MEAMAYMTKVFKAMAIRAQNFEIIPNIIVPVPIFMMNSKYVRIFIKPASFAPCYFASFFHIGANCCKRWCAIFNLLLIAALNRAILFTRAFCSWIRYSAGLADTRLFGGISSVSIIAYTRAIFCYTNPRIKNIENFMAN